MSGYHGVAPHGEAPLAALQSSAMGWHGIQLAVLGFIGLCGVIQGNAGKDNPEWVRDIAAVLVLGSLVLACLAVAIVGTVAWPVDGAGGGDQDARLVKGARRLRGGIALTFVAVAALAAGATSGWWPGLAPSSAVEVTTRAGVVCGGLVEASPGSVGVRVGGRTIALSLGQIISLRSVPVCD